MVVSAMKENKLSKSRVAILNRVIKKVWLKAYSEKN